MKTQKDVKGDMELQRDVLREFEWAASIDTSQIGVTAREGVVTLNGHVPTNSEWHAAEELTKRVHGVKAIANEIEVRPSESHVRDDEQIALAAVQALEWDARVPKDAVQVVVRHGWVTLDGTTDTRFEKDAAERAIRHLVGIRGVTNSILVESGTFSVPDQVRSTQLKDDIESALRRSSMLNSKEINVEVSDNAVVLTGDVRSHAERDEVARIAWMAPGITHVDNCVTITLWGCGPMEEWGY